jgi:ribose 5-phosphate isomerase RpiB
MKKYLGLLVNEKKLSPRSRRNSSALKTAKKSVIRNNNYMKSTSTYDFLFIGCDKESEKITNELVDYFNRMYPTKVLINLGSYRLYPDSMIIFKKTLNKMKGDVSYDGKLAIFIGQSAAGMAMCANKIKKIRAAVCNNINDVFGCVTQQNMNVMCLNNTLNMSELSHIVESFMRLEFQPVDVHVKNVDKINKM